MDQMEAYQCILYKMYESVSQVEREIQVFVHLNYVDISKCIQLHCI